MHKPLLWTVLLLATGTPGMAQPDTNIEAQIQDITIAHLPRLLAVAVSLALLGPWKGRQIAAFAERAFLGT